MFHERASQLVSDGAVEETKTVHVSTTTGAALTSEKVIDVLKDREQRRIDQQKQRSQAQEQRKECSAAREVRLSEAQRK